MMASFSFIVFFCCLAVGARAQGDAASACNAVLQQGVYNIVSTSSSSSSFSSFQSSMCSSLLTSSSYSDYVNSASTSSSSRYYQWNADASVLGIGGGGGGGGGQSQLTQSEFMQLQKAAASYQSSYCSSSSGSSGDSSAFNSLIESINPQVYQSYQSCLSLYSTGIHFTTQNGYGSNSVFVNIKFVSQNYGASAALTGVTIVPNGSAKCTLYGDTGAGSNFFLKMVPAETYSVACYSLNTPNVDVITVGISTTQGTYLTYLYNQPPPALLSQVQAQVSQLQAQLQGQILQLNTAPQITILSQGTGTYNKPVGAVYLRVRMVGGGGGGAGGTNSSPNSGNPGGVTIFGDSTANGGNAGGGPIPCANGEGGAAVLGSDFVGAAFNGGNGLPGTIVNNPGYGSGGSGGECIFGGGGSGGYGNAVGSPGAPYTGAGGGGGGTSAVSAGSGQVDAGGGGGAGGCVDAIIPKPSSSYVYSVGAGGAGGPAGTNGLAGGNGADGLIEVTAYF